MRLFENEKREIDAFFTFPDDWFPKPSVVTYRVLLDNLLKVFRGRWPNEFHPSLLRKWIDCAKEFYANPDNPDSGNLDKSKFPTDFEPLELPLIFELARHEHAASLPPETGLAFLADEVAAQGYKSATGYRQRKSYKDKLAFQQLFEKRRNDVRYLPDLNNYAEFATYVQNHDPEVLRDWINEIAPGHLRKGRPPRK